MKILLSTHQFFPRSFGGVETYTLRLAQTLQRLGHIVHILTGEPVAKPDLSVTTKTEVYEGVPVTRLGYDFLRRPAGLRAAYHDPLMTNCIKAFLHEWQPDVVHSTSLSLLMGGTVEAAVTCAVPLVYTATDFVLVCRRGTYIKQDHTTCSIKEELMACTRCMGPYTSSENWLAWGYQLLPDNIAPSVLSLAERVIGKRADFIHAESSIQHRLSYLPYWRSKISHIIAPSSYMREMLVLNHIPADKITVSPYGVEAPTPVLKKEPASVLRFGFIGRITFIKGVHLLVEAFANLPELAQRRVQLTIYGDSASDSYGQILKQKVAGLPHVNFAGRIDNANLAQIYQRLDCLIVPSLWPENCPVTILEAQAYGTPVITSDVGSIRDLIRHEENGLIFANQEVDDLIRQITRCIAEPELISRLASQSRIIRSMEEDAIRLVALYQQLI
jgi:glycosyltransferase involved in cell wall biosynthesis